MSYITPDSDIIILQNCPLNPNYDHTIYFSSSSAQTAYFQGLAKYSLSAQSYQRAHKGTMRVQLLADDIYNCNYLMFRNTAFGTKWFYAFITNVTYINNVTSEIKYVIDVLQTWHFNYTLNMCLVEREHTATDVIGEHILPEGLECGEYVANSTGQMLTTDYTNYPPYYVVAISDTELSTGGYYDTLYSGLYLKYYNRFYTSQMKSLLESYLSDPDAIISIYTIPYEAVEYTDPADVDYVLSQGDTKTMTFTSSALTGSETLDGYTPKNKKMYTYPYNYYMVNTPSGDSLSLRYEFFTSGAPSFELTLPVTLPVNVVCRPRNYKGNDGATVGESITLSGYPLLSWNYDAYAAYIAQNAVPSMLGYAVRFAGLAASISTGGVVGGNFGGSGLASYGSVDEAQQGYTVEGISGSAGALSNLINYTVSRMQTNYAASIAADPVKGSTTNGNGDIGAHHQTFYTHRMSVNYEVAQQIDAFFTKYGYSVNLLKIPNRTARSHYTYVKTIDCCITGDVPADDKAFIEKLYNHGITWWLNGSEIGDYSVDNTV